MNKKNYWRHRFSVLPVISHLTKPDGSQQLVEKQGPVNFTVVHEFLPYYHRAFFTVTFTGPKKDREIVITDIAAELGQPANRSDENKLVTIVSWESVSQDRPNTVFRQYLTDQGIEDICKESNLPKPIWQFVLDMIVLPIEFLVDEKLTEIYLDTCINEENQCYRRQLESALDQLRSSYRAYQELIQSK